MAEKKHVYLIKPTYTNAQKLKKVQTEQTHNMAQSAGAAEYTDCTSAERLDFSKEFPGFVTKQSDNEAPVMLELWGIRSTALFPSIPGLLWFGTVAPDRVLSMV